MDEEVMSTESVDNAAAPLAIGERQTVHYVLHPKRGLGLAVYRNGPSFFVPLVGVEMGEPVAMHVDWGGVESKTETRPHRAWMVLRDPVHGRVEADRIEPKHPLDLHHDRMWNKVLGLGWLVSGPEFAMRFDGDDGKVTDLGHWRAANVGTPDYVARNDRSEDCIPITPEEQRWRTYRFSDGTTLAFRFDGPPPDPATAPAPDGVQLGLFGGRR